MGRSLASEANSALRGPGPGRAELPLRQGAGGSADATESCRALGRGAEGEAAAAPPLSPLAQASARPGRPHWDGMGLPRPRAPARHLWWPALTQRGSEPRPCAPTAALCFAGLAPGLAHPWEPRLPATAVSPAPGTWALRCKRRPSPSAGRASRDLGARGGREPVWGRGVPTQGGKHPSRCGRFLGELKCYGSKSILRSNLSSLSSWPQEAQLNHAGTM